MYRSQRGEPLACAAIIPEMKWRAKDRWRFYGVAIAGDGVKGKVGCGQLGDIDFHFEGEFILANILVGDWCTPGFPNGSGYDVAFRRRQPSKRATSGLPRA